jgi:hypothetical protein
MVSRVSLHTQTSTPPKQFPSFSYLQQLGLDWELDDAHELANYQGLVSQIWAWV